VVIFYLAGLRKRKLKAGDLAFPKLQFPFSLQERGEGRDKFHNPFCFTAPSV
jgi:hypothetical protein